MIAAQGLSIAAALAPAHALWPARLPIALLDAGPRETGLAAGFDDVRAATAIADEGGLPPGTGYVVLLLLAGVLWYLASCAWWPFARCLSCKGTGRHSRKDRKVWRICRRCGGNGRRLRIGRRIFNWSADRKRSGS